MAVAGVMLITGASTGIGAATARQAVAAGWRVVLGARSEERLRSLASELGGDGVSLAGPWPVRSDQLGSRAPRAAGIPVLGHQARGHGHGRGPSPRGLGLGHQG